MKTAFHPTPTTHLMSRIKFDINQRNDNWDAETVMKEFNFCNECQDNFYNLAWEGQVIATVECSSCDGCDNGWFN